jgi:hypothetical protein
VGAPFISVNALVYKDKIILSAYYIPLNIPSSPFGVAPSFRIAGLS